MRNEVGSALSLRSGLKGASLTQGTTWAMSASLAFRFYCAQHGAWDTMGNRQVPASHLSLSFIIGTSSEKGF